MVIACVIDLTRLGVYAASFDGVAAALDYRVLAAAIGAAFLGAVIGNAYLSKVTMPGIQRLVAIGLFLVAAGLVTGVL